MENKVLLACQAGIQRWQEAFNSQNATGCSEQYFEDAVMIARPFGTFEGKEAIKAFWQNIIDQGFKDVSYTAVLWEKDGEDGYILSSKWTMNNAFGVVHKEQWKVANDGHARLIFDEFELLGEC